MNELMLFFEKFKNYHASIDARELLNDVLVENVKIQKDSEGHITSILIYGLFSKHIPYDLLRSCEQDMIRSYRENNFKDLKTLRIFPKYTPEMFQLSHMTDLLKEVALMGGVSYGFFDEAEYVMKDGVITISIPFIDQGVQFVTKNDTERYLSILLKDWYGLSLRVEVISSDNAYEKTKSRESMYEEILHSYETGSMIQKNTKEKESSKEAPTFPRGNTEVLFNTPYTKEVIDEHTIKIGNILFDYEQPKSIFGESFDLSDPLPIGHVNGKKEKVVLFGHIFSFEAREIKNKEKLALSIGITDGVHSIYVKKTSTPGDFPWKGALEEPFGKGKALYIAVLCNIDYDQYDKELTATPLSITQINKTFRKDNAQEKRVELHLHTTMSQMDGFIVPQDLVERATKWGWKAVAVTDHGNVQGFPETMLAAKGKDLKILWGIEAYYVNDKARAIYGTERPTFEDEMVVFDIETTGLNSKMNEIIEIGAVRIKNKEIIETFDTFIKPNEPIPEEITKLTSITNEMVEDAPNLESGLKAFLDFAGNDLLIAHNAPFDCGFVREACEKLGWKFKNTYLDTVGVSRYLNPEIAKHKLDVLQKHYKLEDFHHHRASDDAEMLARIFFCMLDQLEGEGIKDFERMDQTMGEKSDPLKQRPYHMVIFAKNLRGLKTLYQLISQSYLTYYRRFPRIPRSILETNREDLIIGSACESGELYQAVIDNRAQNEIEEIASFYDYLEIQPVCNNRFLIAEGKVKDDEDIRNRNRQIVALGEKLNKPVVATCDAHFMDKEDELYRKIILKGMKFKDGDKDTGIYLRTTEEMLEEFSYLGEEKAKEVVIENTNKIADMVDVFQPIPDGRYEPKLEGAEEDLENSCWKKATELYAYDANDGNGPQIPELVSARLSKELNAIKTHGFSVLYMIAVKLVAYSESQGYLVGSRGSVGSSFVASMSGVSEVNPLKPHYRCPKCKYTEFFLDGSVGSGFDLPDKECPKCGTQMIGDGQDIPFETFLGFKGDKSPDIDLNFSGEVQGKVHKYTEELFGEGNVFRAGTVGTVADKTAVGYVLKYLDEKNISLSRADVSAIATSVAGVKRSTGQHPGGIIVIPKEYNVHDFTPVQHPADDPTSNIITTHFQFTYLHETILKLDELGHDMPTKYKMLEKYTNTSVLDVKMNDQSVYQLFESCEPLGIKPEDIGGCKLGTYGLPEMGTQFVQGVLLDSKPKNFADLLQIMGLTHGTDVWLGNAQDLIKNNICDISHVIGTRDGIMIDLIRYGLPDGDAFTIMEAVRKGKGLKPEWEEEMKEHNVPDWYIASCKKIKYMFPKAHAAAYGMSAIRLGWYKIHYPLEFYAAFLSVAPGGFDAEIVLQGKSYVRSVIDDILKKPSQETTQKDKEMVSTFKLVEESMARGIEYLPPDLHKSHEFHFLPENGKIRMPFSSLGGLGETTAHRLSEVVKEGPIYTVNELKAKAGLSKANVELLRSVHVLDGLTENNQLAFF